MTPIRIQCGRKTFHENSITIRYPGQTEAEVGARSPE